MFCVNCGQKLPDNSTFCNNCGKIISKKRFFLEKIKSTKMLTKEIIIPVLILLVIIIFYNVINNNAVQNGWSKDGNKFYEDGRIIKNDWVLYNNDWYYFNNNGKCVKSDWISYDGEYYYFGYNGIMVKNQWVGDYYLDSDGKMLKDSLTQDGYYVETSGKYIKSQWKEIGGNYFYFLDNGMMAKNIWVGEYYIGADGIMLQNTYTPDGFWVSNDGKKQINFKNNTKGFDPELVKIYEESSRFELEIPKFDSSGRLWVKRYNYILNLGSTQTNLITIYRTKENYDVYEHSFIMVGRAAEDDESKYKKNGKSISISSGSKIFDEFENMVDAYK